MGLDVVDLAKHLQCTNAVGTEWVFPYADHPEFAWEIVGSDPQLIIWRCTYGNFRKCNTTWAVLLHHLRDYVETGYAAEVFE